ncbi:MAG: hypothetical protein MRY78_07105, partial [Saprospiraceae bacterium]|nr:hypothetical protein [Saprospiraceae bacterium]
MKNQLLAFGCIFMCHFLVLTNLQGQNANGQNSLESGTPCGLLNVVSADFLNETDCGAKDGMLDIQLEDSNETPSTYMVDLLFNGRPLNLNDRIVVNGKLKITGLAPGRYSDIKVTRELDGCTSEMLTDEFQLSHACNFDESGRSTNCGSGTISYNNCDGETITVNKANIAPNTYIYVDDDFLGCIAKVSGSCSIQTSVPVFCANVNKTEPTPDQGYNYGDVTFTRVVGAVNAGYTELQAERVNWAMCNGPSLGYNDWNINNSIWYLLNNSNFNNCNGLCADAIDAVQTPVGGIEDQMVFFIPDNGSVQPFVENECRQSTVPCTDNIISQGGFEGSGSWNYGSGAVRSTGAAYAGSYSLKLDNPNAVANQDFNLIAGQTFNLTLWANNESPTNFSGVVVDYLNSSGTEIGEEGVVFANATNSWVQYALSGTAPTGTASARVVLYRNEASDGNVWVDEVCIQASGVTPTDPAPSNYNFECGD